MRAIHSTTHEKQKMKCNEVEFCLLRIINCTALRKIHSKVKNTSQGKWYNLQHNKRTYYIHFGANKTVLTRRAFFSLFSLALADLSVTVSTFVADATTEFWALSVPVTTADVGTLQVLGTSHVGSSCSSMDASSCRTAEDDGLSFGSLTS